MTTTPRTVRVPDDWWDAIESAAARAGQTPSEWIVDAIREQLPKKVRARLSKSRGRGRPPRSAGNNIAETRETDSGIK